MAVKSIFVSRRFQSAGLRALFLFKRMMMLFFMTGLEQSLQSMRGCLKGMWMIEHGREVSTVMLGLSGRTGREMCCRRGGSPAKLNKRAIEDAGMAKVPTM